jgi:hypothetical protein
MKGTATGGTATLSTSIPPGLVKPGQQFVDVVAVYGGDDFHLASTSSKVGVGFAPLSFAIVPEAVHLAINGTKSFSTTGGQDPVSFFIDYDSTASFTGGAQIGETDGGLTAGPVPGFIIVEALDKFGVEALAQITVGAAVGPAPWADGGVFLDAAVPPTDAAAKRDSSVPDAGHHPKDAGHEVEEDAGEPPHDSGGFVPPLTNAGGGGCSQSPGGHESPWSFAPLGLALGLIARRRSTRRS